VLVEGLVVVFGGLLVAALGLLLPGADFTRVSLPAAVPALGFTDWPAVVPPPVEPVPPVGAAF
jgi:hypothetical protein